MLRNGLLLVLLATTMGCSSMHQIARDIGLIDKPARVGLRTCKIEDINSFNSLYIDSSQDYFLNGSAIVYGRDGTRCKLRLRYQ
jgi:hypothetical protein